MELKNLCTMSRLLIVALAVLLLGGMSLGAAAQSPGADPAQTDPARYGTQDGAAQEQIRQQFQEGIDSSPGLSQAQRQNMHRNLDACLNLGLSEPQLASLFPEQGSERRYSGAALLGYQNRVLKLAQEGLPAEPLLAKIQEGLTKGVPEPALERALNRMENNVRVGQRVMIRAKENDLVPVGDPARERRMVGEMAQHMWRGMSEEGLAQLREQAQLRRRKGDCSIEDMVWASEVATRLHEEGVELGESVRFAGDALRRGYRVPQMRELRFMVAARHGDRPIDGFFEDMEHCLSENMGLGNMYNYMMQHGWMGPGDMHDPGGSHPIDDVGGGPGRYGGTGEGGKQGGGEGGSGGGGKHGGTGS